MAKSDITGKRKLLAQNVSHSNIKTKRWQNVNVQSRRLWVPELARFIRLNVTTRDLRTIDKIGLVAYAKQHGILIALARRAARNERGGGASRPLRRSGFFVDVGAHRASDASHATTTSSTALAISCSASPRATSGSSGATRDRSRCSG